MNDKTGEIREYKKISPEEMKKSSEVGKWSKPFHVGMELEVLGIKMKIAKIKKMRGEIVLTYAGVRK